MTTYTVRGGRNQFVGTYDADSADAAIKMAQRNMTESGAKIIGRLSAKAEPKRAA